MTLESRVNKHRYIGNGSTRTFAFAFKTWKKDQIKVFVGNGKTESDVSASVTVERTASGGSVTFRTAPKQGQIIVIRRNMPYIQEDDYRNGSRFDSEEVEDRFDQDCAERQDLLLGLERALKVPETSASSGDDLVAQILDAYADIMAALAQAGDIAGATPVIASGTTTPRTISDRFADIVNVRDFGAKGNGVADDTAAVQAAADAAVDKRLYFPAGKYRITDTIDLPKGNVDFGGSTILWDGETGGTMLHVNQCDVDGNTIGYIHDGTINGRWKAADGLVVDCQWTNVSHMYIKNCTHDNIALGHESTTNRRSLGCYLYNVIVQIGEEATQGSDENQARGIAIYEADNKITACGTLACNKSVYAKVPGNMFTNCHFCATYKAPRADIANEYAVFFDFYEEVGTYATVFSNCYFDNHKYVFYSNTDSTERVICSNSMYYNSGRQVSTEGFYNAYMLGGHSLCLSVRNFSIRQSGHCRFFNATMGVDASMLMNSMISESYAKNIDAGTAGRQLPYLAQYLVGPDECRAVVRSSATIASGAYYCIGCIVIPNTTNLDRFGGAAVTVKDRGFGWIDLEFWYDGASNDWHYRTDIRKKSTVYGVAVGAPQTVTVNSIQSIMLPLYIHAQSAISGAIIYASVRTGGVERAYLCGDVAAECTSSSYIVDASGYVDAGSGHSFTTLHDLNLDADATLLQVCNALPVFNSVDIELMNGDLFDSLPGDGDPYVKFLRAYKGGTGVSTVDCRTISLTNGVQAFSTMVGEVVHDWTELGGA